MYTFIFFLFFFYWPVYTFDRGNSKEVSVGSCDFKHWDPLLQAMEKLVEQGLCKAIGISNFTIKKTITLLETAKIIPACNQGTNPNVLSHKTMSSLLLIHFINGPITYLHCTKV